MARVETLAIVAGQENPDDGTVVHAREAVRRGS
jgi:hypothetical protein